MHDLVFDALMSELQMSPCGRKLGVLGGMGPLATVDFLRKLVVATPASRDQEHIPMVVGFCPEIPDRTEAIEGRGPSPREILIAEARNIERAGASLLVIPCNTAHYWYEQIAFSLDIPILHIADAAVERIPAEMHAQPVGLLGTRGTLNSRIYQSRHPELKWLLPSDRSQDEQVMPAIRAVKAGDTDAAANLLASAIDALLQRGAKIVVLGCTELPVACGPRTECFPLIDATDALARGAIRWIMASASTTKFAAGAAGG